jgi:uncharacterized protein (TIGR02646 family)
MRTIQKREEPPSLAQYRHSPGATYSDFRHKDVLRSNLVQEQRGLCCYCMSRIRDEPGAVRIEHWHCQERFPNEDLAYANLLAACKGNEGALDQHCDTRKGNQDLSRNPANPDHHVEDLIRYMGDGTIAADDQTFQRELNEVLNLNAPFLKSQRKKVLTALQGFWDTKRGQVSAAVVDRLLRKWTGETNPGGGLEPFSQVAVYWLRKRQARNLRPLGAP